MRVVLLLVLLLFWTHPETGLGAPPKAPDCRVPAELLDDDPLLPGLSQRLRQKQPVTIIAIGGAGTAGRATGNPGEYAYPHRLELALRRRYPGVPVTVINRGVPRETAQDMVDRFARDVFSRAADLVIWETGTFDSVRGTDVEEFSTVIQSGIAALRAHHLEVMLMDMQYSRSTDSVIDFEPYLQAMRRTADLNDVYLFRRFEIMKYWSENGIFDFAEVPPGQRGQLAAEVYDCLAERLADAIGHATR